MRLMGFGLATLAFVGCAAFTSAGEPPTTTGDAGGEASTEADSGSGSSDGGADFDAGCIRVFHEHFVTLTDPPWEKTELNGSAGVSDGAGQNNTGALRASVNAPPTDEDTAAQVVRSFTAGTAKTVSLAFAMRVESANSEYFELGCSLEFRTVNGTYLKIDPELLDHVVRVDDNAKLGGAGFTTGDAVTVGDVTLDKWYQVKIHATQITAMGANVFVEVDSKRYLERAVTFPAPPAEVRVKCGIDYADPDAQGVVFVDDVTFDTCP